MLWRYRPTEDRAITDAGREFEGGGVRGCPGMLDKSLLKNFIICKGIPN